MKHKLRTTEKILTITVFYLLFFSVALASELGNTNTIDQYDSMYKYSAIENNSIYPDLVANDLNKLEEILPDEIININQESLEKRLEEISEKQNSYIQLTEDSINEINNMGEIKSFLIGSNLRVLNFQIVQINNLIFRLNDLLIQTENIPNEEQMKTIYIKIKLLRDEQVKIDNFILEQEKRFSLFGWIISSL